MAISNEIRVHAVRLRSRLLQGLRPVIKPKQRPDEEPPTAPGDGETAGGGQVGSRRRVQRAAPRPPPAESAPPAAAPGGPGSGGGIYVLELEQGYIYVGKSCNTKRRLMQHAGGNGSSFTRRFKPTGRRLPRLGCLEGEGDGPERDETLRQMHAHGMDRVRGWKFCTRRRKLNRSQRQEAESNIRELFDLCRRCGREGHFAWSCRMRTDRHGRGIC